jgi:dTDP-4-dehydrorhamnose reductase
VLIFIVGASGFLGSYILKSCKQVKDITALGTCIRNPQDDLISLDITKPEDVRSVITESETDCIINCAAMTSVDECEQKPELARSINSIGAKNLAEICQRHGIKLIHISTDSIFEGKSGGYSEESEPHPVNTYAQTKLEGEKFVASITRNHIIIRTNFYGINPHGKHLLNWILSNLLSDKEMIGFDDTRFNPLWVQDLAQCILKLTTIPYQGTLHCAANDIFSKYEFIKKIAFGLGYRNAKIKKGTSNDVSSLSLAQRPKNTYLANKRMHQLLNIKINKLEEVLQNRSFDIYRSKEFKKIS